MCLAGFDLQRLIRDAAFSVLRVWGLYGRFNVAVVLTFIFSMFVPAINVVGTLFSSMLPAHHRDLLTVSRQYNYARPALFVVADGSCGEVKLTSVGQ